MRYRLVAVGAWCAEHPTWAAAAGYALVAGLFVGQGLLPDRTLSGSDLLWSGGPWRGSEPPGVRPGGANFELADATTVFEPFFAYAKESLPKVPLWNPHIMGGRPFLADAQSAVFSPFNIPFYVLPLSKGLGVTAMLKLFVAALGTFCLGRALGMRSAGAFLAGLVFSLGTFFVVWLAWPLTSIFCLLPWLLLVADRIARDPGRLPAAALAVLVALAFLGGHPETSFHTLVVTGLFFASRLVQARRGQGRSVLRPLLTFAGAGALGIALAGLMLLPLAEFMLHSGDYARRLEVPPGHAEARYLGSFLLPDYWGRPTQTPLVGDILSNRGFYAGALTLMLAGAALLLRPTALRLGLAALALLALAMVLGTEPIFSLVTALPGFRTAHNGRLVFVVLFVLALLAGFGLDELTKLRRRRRPLAFAFAFAILCLPVAWMLLAGTVAPGQIGRGLEVAWGFVDPPPGAPGQPPDARTADVVRMSALWQWLVLAGAGVALIAARVLGVGGRRLPAAAFAALAIGLTAIDLFRATMGFNTAIPISHAAQPATPAIEYLRSRAPNRFAVLSRVDRVNQPLQPNINMRYGLYDARGYDYPVEKRYDDLWRSTARFADPLIQPPQRAADSARALRTLSLLGVSDLLHYADGPAPRPRGLTLVYKGSDARVYHNPGALPRAFVVSRQRTVPGADAALRAVSSPAFDGRRVVITERRLPELSSAEPPGRGEGGSARIEHYGAERVSVRASSRGSGLLVLSDVYFPGWKATVDGRPVGIERVNYLLRGVPLRAGTHRVEFRYEPLGWRLGWILSLLAGIVVVLLTVSGLRARSRR